MADIRARYDANGWVAVYHYTAPFLGPLIAETGFRMSTQGQGDGGVYFPPAGPRGLRSGLARVWGKYHRRLLRREPARGVPRQGEA